MHWCPRLVWVVQARTLSGCACGKEAARCALAESTAVGGVGGWAFLGLRCMVLAAEGGLPILSDAC